MHNNKAFTLVELLIAMVLFLMVIMITGSAFSTILGTAGRLASSEESATEGLIGLEMLRQDLQQAGFGLLTAYKATPPDYTEATAYPANGLNDAASTSRIPRAVASINDFVKASGRTSNILTGTDYLAIKATAVGRARVTQKWTFATYSSGSIRPKIWPSAAENFASSDNVIVLNRTYSPSGTVSSTLVYDSPGQYWLHDPTSALAGAFKPGQEGAYIICMACSMAPMALPPACHSTGQTFLCPAPMNCLHHALRVPVSSIRRISIIQMACTAITHFWTAWRTCRWSLAGT